MVIGIFITTRSFTTLGIREHVDNHTYPLCAKVKRNNNKNKIIGYLLHRLYLTIIKTDINLIAHYEKKPLNAKLSEGVVTKK